MKSVSSRALLGFAAGWLIVLGLGILGYETTRGLIAATAARQQTALRLEAMSALLSSLKDAETGQRGYLLTGRESYLVPHDAAVGAIAREMSALRDAAKLEAGLAERMPRLELLTSEKLGELAQTIALRRRGLVNEAIDVVLTDRGKDRMDAIRALLGEAGAVASSQLEIREQLTRSRAVSALAVLPAGFALALAMLA
ncbi:MAG: CHASE3 domain-containing protein, partial [Myxococcota bacterium]|nr:CHASE3 domain-containing protein [Myxococcota bacterium]